MAKPASPSDKSKPSSAKPAVKPAAKTGMSQKDLEVAAYYNWINRGCSHGDDQKDWFEAQKDAKKK